MTAGWKAVWSWLDAAVTRRVILALGWLTLIVYAYPGYLTWDSVQQLQEARHPPLTDWHPPMMALLWRLTDSITRGPFPMLALQTSVMLLGLDGIFRRVMSPRRAAIAAVAVFLFPPVMVVMAVIWKDSLMAGLLLAGVAAILSTERRWRVVGCMLLTMATALRYNAPAATFPIVLLLFQWREGIARLRRYGLAFAVWIAITAIAFGASKLATGKASYAWHGSVAIFDIAGVLATTPTLTDDEIRAELRDLKPVPSQDVHNKLRKQYGPAWWGPLLFGDDRVFEAPQTEADRAAVAATWQRLVTEHPSAYIAHRCNVFLAALGIGGAPTGAVWTGFHTDLESKLLGHHAIRSRVQANYADLLRRFENSFVFRAWVYAILALVILPLCWRSRAAFAVVGSGILYEVTLLVIAPSSDYRYSHWMILCTAIGVVLGTTARLHRLPRQAPPASPGSTH